MNGSTYQLFKTTVFHSASVCPELAKVTLPLSQTHTHTYSVTNPHQSHTMPSPLPLLGDRRIKCSTEHCSKYKQQLWPLCLSPGGEQAGCCDKGNHAVIHVSATQHVYVLAAGLALLVCGGVAFMKQGGGIYSPCNISKKCLQDI